MQQKRTWRPYLLIGINILILSLSGCSRGESDYLIDTEFVFINESNRTIVFTVKNPTTNKTISLSPNERYSSSHLAEAGYDNPNPESCCQGVLNGVLDGADRGDIIVEYDNKTCFIEAPAMISNYTNEILGHRLFRYTFVFTDEVLENPIRCL